MQALLAGGLLLCREVSSFYMPEQLTDLGSTPLQEPGKMEEIFARMWAFLLPYYSDPGFWVSMGALLAFGWSVLRIIGTISGLLNYIFSFFSHTVEPGALPTRPGPSPFQQFLGCIGSLVTLVIVLFLLGIAGYSLLSMVFK